MITRGYSRITPWSETLALLVILFDGGLSTTAKRVREAIVPATVLATIGFW